MGKGGGTPEDKRKIDKLGTGGEAQKGCKVTKSGEIKSSNLLGCHFFGFLSVRI